MVSRERKEPFVSTSRSSQSDARIDDARLGEETSELGYVESGSYRMRVGRPEWYERLAAMQVSLLFVAGLMDYHRLAYVRVRLGLTWHLVLMRWQL